MRNFYRLSPREWTVLMLVRHGIPSTQLAERLRVDRVTARRYLNIIYDKLEIPKNRHRWVLLNLYLKLPLFIEGLETVAPSEDQFKQSFRTTHTWNTRKAKSVCA